MEKKNRENAKNLSHCIKNVYDTRKKKIRKKSIRQNPHNNNNNNNNHHVLINNSSNDNATNNSNCSASENLIGLMYNSDNYRSSSCYIKRRKFPILLFLLIYYCSYCYFCCSLSSFGVVVLANEEIDSFKNSSRNYYQGFEQVTTTTTMTTTTHAIRETRDILAERLHDLALNDDHEYEDDEEEEPDEDYDITRNKSAKGMYVGAPCEFTCSVKLHHVFCDPATNTCGCEKNYPVLIDRRKGCAKPKKLGEQCLYHQICAYNDPNSLCVQIKHNAICECAEGYHSVSYLKPTKRIFCTQDMAVITSNLPTLLGVITSITVLGGLICMVLYLFSKNKYPRARDYGDAHLSPPIMYASDTARPSSRSSQRSSGSISSYGHRRTSGVPLHGSKGVLVSASRTGSRRPSLASVHSTSSSVKSYSMKRFEQELQQKELRQEMKKQLTKLQEQQQLQRVKPCIIIGDAIPFTVTRTILPTPSPITPKSTDELLPSVCEEQEFSPSLSSNKSGSSSNNIPIDDSISVKRPSTSKDLL